MLLVAMCVQCVCCCVRMCLSVWRLQALKAFMTDGTATGFHQLFNAQVVKMQTGYCTGTNDGTAAANDPTACAAAAGPVCNGTANGAGGACALNANIPAAAQCAGIDAAGGNCAVNTAVTCQGTMANGTTCGLNNFPRPATCTGTDAAGTACALNTAIAATCGNGTNAAGVACALNGAGDACAVADGSCWFQAAVPVSSRCEVQSGTCKFRAAAAASTVCESDTGTCELFPVAKTCAVNTGNCTFLDVGATQVAGTACAVQGGDCVFIPVGQSCAVGAVSAPNCVLFRPTLYGDGVGFNAQLVVFPGTGGQPSNPSNSGGTPGVVAYDDSESGLLTETGILAIVIVVGVLVTIGIGAVIFFNLAAGAEDAKLAQAPGSAITSKV
jgi:hypothetical protein